MPYEEVDHTADWALRVRGDDLADLLRSAAAAMLAACGATAAPGEPRQKSLQLRSSDAEGLLVAWLEEILYSLEVEQRVPSKIRVAAPDEISLEADWTDLPLAGVDKPIKAVTFHDLAVVAVDGGLEATVVFDV